MKNQLVKTVVAAIGVLMLAALNAEAKWWIFGRSESVVSVKYLYFNNISIDELPPEVTMYQDLLIEGQIVIRGRGTATGGAVAGVRVSLDGKGTWQDAKLSDKGEFEFAFKPEIGRVYTVLIEVTNSTGKTNEVEATRRQITVSDQRIGGMVAQALAQLGGAYMREDLNEFMSWVSPEFAGDATLLRGAVQKDFNAFVNLNLLLTPVSVVADRSGRVVVNVNYRRTVVGANSGGSFIDNGTTEFSFAFGPQGLLLARMKNPLIFGLSDAANVATGSVVSGQNQEILVVSSTGNIAKQDFDQALKSIEEGGQSAAMGVLNSVPGTSYESFKFVDGDRFTEVPWGTLPAVTTQPNTISGDFAIYGTNVHIILKTGVEVANLGAKKLETVHTAPAGGYQNGGVVNGSNLYLVAGNCYVFKMPNGSYAAIEVTSKGGARLTFRYKYSPVGTAF